MRRRRRADLIIGFGALGCALLLVAAAVVMVLLFVAPIAWRVWF